jgi:hypothetical protein
MFLVYGHARKRLVMDRSRYYSPEEMVNRAMKVSDNGLFIELAEREFVRIKNSTELLFAAKMVSVYHVSLHNEPDMDHRTTSDFMFMNTTNDMFQERDRRDVSMGDSSPVLSQWPQNEYANEYTNENGNNQPDTYDEYDELHESHEIHQQKNEQMIDTQLATESDEARINELLIRSMQQSKKDRRHTNNRKKNDHNFSNGVVQLNDMDEETLSEFT